MVSIHLRKVHNLACSHYNTSGMEPLRRFERLFSTPITPIRVEAGSGYRGGKVEHWVRVELTSSSITLLGVRSSGGYQCKLFLQGRIFSLKDGDDFLQSNTAVRNDLNSTVVIEADHLVILLTGDFQPG